MKYIMVMFLLAALAACGEKSEPFYTASYPVVRIEAAVTLTQATPTEDPENPEEPEEPEENPLVQQIREDVLAAAPVQAGGGYRLAFLYHNSGWAYITPAPDAAPVTGSFNKEPDKQNEIRFFIEDDAYTCQLSYYLEEGKSLTLFTVDLTAHYQALYPDAGITRVARLEYTSHPY